jgi:AraC-like DNA-binding protein
VRRVGARLAPLLDPRLAEAARLLRRHGSVRLAAESVGLSERQLERLFQDRFGLAPKRYASILRMRRAIRAASNGLSLADAALEAGYVDQAHFNRDVRILAGATPGALIPNVGVSQDKRVETRDY